MTEYKCRQLPVGWDSEVLSMILNAASVDGYEYVDVIGATVLVLKCESGTRSRASVRPRRTPDQAPSAVTAHSL